MTEGEGALYTALVERVRELEERVERIEDVGPIAHRADRLRLIEEHLERLEEQADRLWRKYREDKEVLSRAVTRLHNEVREIRTPALDGELDPE